MATRNDEKRRILILGGSNFQVPLIKMARSRGHHVITCDYLPENPGHALADEYYNVSTTDKEAVLKLAKQLDIDAIASFSSEPALQTVAYVANTLNLPGPPLEAVIMLTEKDRFRDLLRRLGLNSPRSFSVDRHVQNSKLVVPEWLEADHMRIIVKPVDSSGSKGITVMHYSPEALQSAIQGAMHYSISGRCIIEEYMEGIQVHGDGFLSAGKLVYHYLGDHYFYTRTNNRIPISTRWPSRVDPAALDGVTAQVEKVAVAAGYLDGPVNIEARIDDDLRSFLVEVSPRNGGNFVPLIQEHLSGFDFTARVLDIATNVSVVRPLESKKYKPGAYYILHADHDGVFEDVFLSDEIRSRVFNLVLFKQRGDCVKQYTGSNTTLGVVMLEFESISQRDVIMSHIGELIYVVIN